MLKALIAILLLLYSPLLVCSQCQERFKLITGTWTFERFEETESASPEQKRELAKADQFNKTVEINFSANGQYVTVKKRDGKMTRLDAGTWKVNNDCSYIMLQRTRTEILSVDLNQLRITAPDRPVMVLKRKHSPS